MKPCFQHCLHRFLPELSLPPCLQQGLQDSLEVNNAHLAYLRGLLEETNEPRWGRVIASRRHNSHSGQKLGRGSAWQTLERQKIGNKKQKQKRMNGFQYTMPWIFPPLIGVKSIKTTSLSYKGTKRKDKLRKKKKWKKSSKVDINK